MIADRSQMPILDFFYEVYVPTRMITATYRAKQQIEVSCNRLAAMLGRDPVLADLTEEVLARWMLATVGAGLSPTTANMRVKNVLTLARFAKRKKFIPPEQDFEAIQLLRVTRRLPRAWTVEEMEAIIKSARLTRGRFMGVPACKWWPALLLLMYDTGLRRSAAFQVRFADIDFSNKLLCVPPERMKNRVEQYFRLHPQTVDAILDTMPPRRESLYPWPFMHHRALYGRFKTILKRAGLPFTRFDLFHKIRRTTASHLARLVGEPMAIQQLGHQDSSTIKRYVDPRFTANHNGAYMLPRPAWDNPRQVEVEVIGTAEPTMPDAVYRVRLTQEDLRGEGADVFAKLVKQHELTGRDVQDALLHAGIMIRDFADEVGCNVKYLGQVLRGHKPFARKLESKIRVALGLDTDRDGDAGMAGRPCNWKSPAKARRAGVA